MYKIIPDFNDRYLIDENGRIFDTKNWRVIDPHLMGIPRRNYYQVTLYKKDGSKHTKRIHSLMAITFLGHVYGDRKKVVDHIDNSPHNNHISNLQVISMRENNIKDKRSKKQLSIFDLGA
jgi:hypothetical protein